MGTCMYISIAHMCVCVYMYISIVFYFHIYNLLFYRHHTNPVGTEWKWPMDSPQKIVQEALTHHYQMIKEYRG